MFKFAGYILGAALAIGATAAMAGDLPPAMADSVMNSCRPDYHRMCSYVVPGEGRAARCLLDHETELAPACLKALKVAFAIEACMPDYRRYCQGVPQGAAAFACLAERAGMLRPECQRVVSANAPYMRPQQRYGYNGGPAGPYGQPGPQAYPYRYATPEDDRDEAEEEQAPQPYGGYAQRPRPGAEEEQAPRPYGGYAQRQRPEDEDRYTEQEAPRLRPYDDHYAGPGYGQQGYDRDAPAAPYGQDEEREPSR